MRKIYFCISIILLAFSCKKNGESEITPISILKDRCKLIDSKTYNATGILISSSQYVYDVEDRVTQITDEDYTNTSESMTDKTILNIEYSSNSRVSKSTQIYLFPKYSVTYTNEYIYDFNKLIRKIQKGSSNNITEYKYDSNDLLKQEISNLTLSGSVLTSTTNIEYDSQKRVSNKLMTSSNGNFYETLFEYDNRNNNTKHTIRNGVNNIIYTFIDEYTFSDIKNPNTIPYKNLENLTVSFDYISPYFAIFGKFTSKDSQTTYTAKISKTNAKNYPEEVIWGDNKSKTIYTYKDCE